MNWNAAVAKATKVLGKGGKLPRQPKDLATVFPPIKKAMDEFNSARTELEKQLLEVQDQCALAKNIFKQYGDLVDGNDFELDRDNEDDKKRIDEATKILVDGLKEGEDICSDYSQKMAELNKILAHLKRSSPQ